MSAAAPRTISNAPDLRQLGVAVGALILAVALVVAATVSRQGTISPAAPLAAPAPAVHDHGWSSTTPLTISAHDHGLSTAPASGLLIPRTQGGGTLYTGIPYTPTRDSSSVQGGKGTRFAR